MFKWWLYIYITKFIVHLFVFNTMYDFPIIFKAPFHNFAVIKKTMEYIFLILN